MSFLSSFIKQQAENIAKQEAQKVAQQAEQQLQQEATAQLGDAGGQGVQFLSGVFNSELNAEMGGGGGDNGYSGKYGKGGKGKGGGIGKYGGAKATNANSGLGTVGKDDAPFKYFVSPLKATSSAWKGKSIDVLRLYGTAGVSQLYEYKILIHYDGRIGEINDSVKITGKIGNAKITIMGHIKVVDARRYRDDSKEIQLFMITIVPDEDKLLITGKNRIFEQKSAADIISSVLKEHKIKFSKKLQSGKAVKKPFCVQYHQSDWNFIEHLLLENGWYYLFENKVEGSEKSTLTLTDNLGKMHMIDKELHTFSSIDLHDSHYVLEWSHTEQYTVTGYNASHYDFTKATAVQKESGGDSKYSLEFDQSTHTYPHTKKELDSYAGYHAGADKILNITTRHYITCGSSITVLNGKSKDKYYVVKAEYHLNTDFANSWAEASWSYVSKLQCVPASSSGKIPIMMIQGINKLQPKPRIYGAQTAIVIGPKGKEVYTDQWGRVRIRFFWDPKYLSHDKGTKDTCWVRVSHAGASSNGQFYMPRIGDEVLVVFEDGDPERPIVVNSLYNSSNHIPHKPNAKDVNFWRMYKTKSKKDYNQISMDADSKNSKLAIKACHNMNVDVEANLTTKVTKGTIKTSNDKGSVKHVLTDGNFETEITKGNIKNTLIAGGMETKLVKGNIKQELVDGNFSTKMIKGNISETIIDGNLTTIITKGKYSVDLADGDYSIKTLKNAKVEAVGGMTLITAGNRTQTVGTGDTLTIETGNYTVTVTGGNISLTASADISLTAPNISLTGEASISLTAPEISISGEASTSISGATVNISGEGETSLSSAGELSVEGSMITMTGGMVEIN